MGVNNQMPDKRRNIIFLSCIVQQFGYMILSFGYGTAMPQIVAEMGQSAYYALVSVVWALSQAIVAPVASTLGDRIGRKWVNLFSMVLLCVILAVSNFVTSFTLFLVCWFIVGCAVGGLMSGAFLIVTDIYEQKDWGKKQSVLVMALSAGMIVGPLAAGISADAGWSRGIILFPIPFMIIAIVLQMAFLPNNRSTTERNGFDFLGIIYLMMAVVPFILILNFAGNMFDWLSLTMLMLVIVMVLGAILLVKREISIPEPAFAIAAFKNRNVLVGCVITFLGVTYSVLTAGFLVYFAQAVLMSSATSGSTLLLPQVIVSMIMPMFVGRWISKKPNNYRIAFALMGIIFAVVAIGISMIRPGSSMIILYILMAIGGIGYTFFSNCTSPFVTATISPEEKGAAMGCYSCVSNLGSAAIGSVFGMMLSMFSDFNTAITRVFLVGGIVCLLVTPVALIFIKKQDNQ